jgi:UDP-glucuronate 4-epimerase
MTRDGIVGEAFNLGHDEPIPVLEVIATLERVLGRTARIDRQPEKPGEMPVTHADLTKARRLLGYAPQTEFETGVRAFVDWFRRRRGK